MFRYSSGSPSLWSALFLASATLHFSGASSRSGSELSASDSDPEIAQGSVEYCAASCGAPASTSLERSAHCCSEHTVRRWVRRLGGCGFGHCGRLGGGGSGCDGRQLSDVLLNHRAPREYSARFFIFCVLGWRARWLGSSFGKTVHSRASSRVSVLVEVLR